jgi:hypothetical protein
MAGSIAGNTDYSWPEELQQPTDLQFMDQHVPPPLNTIKQCLPLASTCSKLESLIQQTGVWCMLVFQVLTAE